MTTSQISARRQWRKSTRSNSSGDACVEVAGNLPGVVAVRDSKHPDGSHLAFSPAEWRRFTDRVKNA